MATYYWVGGSGTWDNTTNTNWSLSSGGAGGAGVPNSADAVNFNANSGTAATVNVTATAVCNTCTIDKSDINLSLSGSPTFAGFTSLTSGTITLNSYTFTTLTFLSSNSNTRAIAFGTGNITVTGNAATVFDMLTATNFTYTGTPNINSTYSGSTGTRTIRIGFTGASVANAMNLNVSAGSDTIVLTGYWKNVNFTGFAGTLNNSGRYVSGNLTLSTGMTLVAGTNVTYFNGISGIQQITTNGKTIDFPVICDGVGGTFRFEDDFVMGTTRAMTLTNGTLNANGKNVTVGSFALGSGTKTLTLGSGTWTCAGAWNSNTNVANLTVSASTGTISMTSASAKTFSGGAKVWPTLNQGGAGVLTIAQSNTFANITNTVQPATIRFTAGTTQTVSAFSVSGTSGNLITLDTTVAGTRATLSDPSGLVSVSFCSIKDINATGGAFWQAYTVNGNVDAGNNLGWDFNAIAWSYMYNVRKSKRILPGV